MPSDPPAHFFGKPQHPLQRRYEILRAFFHERLTAEAVAKRFGCAVGSVYAMTRDFRHWHDPAAHFFRAPPSRGRPPAQPGEDIRLRIVELRKANLSVPDVRARLHVEFPDRTPSERVIGNVLRKEGFARLPRRTRSERAQALTPRLQAPASVVLDPQAREEFSCERAAGALCLLPWIRRYGLDRAITAAGFPGTRTLPALQSVLAFVALKLSDVRRYSADDLWCMDRGLGLFAGLNVLPKTATLSAYSDRTTRSMHQSLLGSLAALWSERQLVGDTANLDFTTLPHWGSDATLERHWSGTRGRSLVSLSAALAQDPDSGLLLHADASTRNATSDGAVLEFLDFSRRHGTQPRFLVFDSRFTTYAQLARLDREDILFLTVRRRGRRLVETARALEPSRFRQIRVPAASGTRLVPAREDTVRLRGFGGELRQITIRRGSLRRPSFLITNDFEASLSALLRRYARRWLIEKSISEQLSFFHLNRLSSSMVIKVDFDLAVTVFAHNLLRLLALDLPDGYRRLTARPLYDRFLCNAAEIALAPGTCQVSLKKKRDLPALLEALASVGTPSIPWIGDRRISIRGATRS